MHKILSSKTENLKKGKLIFDSFFCDFYTRCLNDKPISIIQFLITVVSIQSNQSNFKKHTFKDGIS